MFKYIGVFGHVYAVNSHGVVCIQIDGEGPWRASHYTLEQFQDAIERGYVKEV